MPFDCGNATLPMPNCPPLLKYCNSHFGKEVDWCNCMLTAEVGGCTNNDNSVILFIVIGVVFGSPLVLFMSAISVVSIYEYCIKNSSRNVLSRMKKFITLKINKYRKLDNPVNTTNEASFTSDVKLNANGNTTLDSSV
jgi:hypothetical protein